MLARDGFSNTSARAIAAEAGTVNGSVFYHFGSMDGLLGSTAEALASRGIARIKAGLGGDRASQEWAKHLSEVIRQEAASTEAQATMELLVGARTSPDLAARVQKAVEGALAFATDEVGHVVDGSPLATLVPVPALAELAAAAVLGLGVLSMNGQELDVDSVARVGSTMLRLVGPKPTVATKGSES